MTNAGAQAECLFTISPLLYLRAPNIRAPARRVHVPGGLSGTAVPFPPLPNHSLKKPAMSIRVALHHRTEYKYDRLTELGPQVVRLRPAPHCRTPIRAYSLKISPPGHYLNWQQDPYGNYLARLVFNEQVTEFIVEVDVQAEMTVINPFDFFLEPTAEMYPFSYTPTLLKDLMPFLHVGPVMDDSPLAQFMRTIDRTPRKTIDFLVELNMQLKDAIGYVIRMEPGVQTCDETLGKRTGSCRDSGWLLVNILRHMGFAARFVSGYLIQLTADVKSLDGPSGPENDFTDLHAWAEVFLPGAGWIGLDPTSGLLAGEGHIPLACTPEPISAAPITGTTSEAECEFDVAMSVARIHEDPRVTQPYTRRPMAGDPATSATRSMSTSPPATCGSRWAASRRLCRSTTWKATNGRPPRSGRTSGGWPAT